jgi:hypothetical protein
VVGSAHRRRRAPGLDDAALTEVRGKALVLGWGAEWYATWTAAFVRMLAFVKSDPPLVRAVGGRADARMEDARLFSATITITEVGERVLAGEADAVKLRGIDRWLGGVHLQSDGSTPVLRWDAEERQFVEA